MNRQTEKMYNQYKIMNGHPSKRVKLLEAEQLDVGGGKVNCGEIACTNISTDATVGLLTTKTVNATVATMGTLNANTVNTTIANSTSINGTHITLTEDFQLGSEYVSGNQYPVIVMNPNGMHIGNDYDVDENVVTPKLHFGKDGIINSKQIISDFGGFTNLNVFNDVNASGNITCSSIQATQFIDQTTGQPLSLGGDATVTSLNAGTGWITCGKLTSADTTVTSLNAGSGSITCGNLTVSDTITSSSVLNTNNVYFKGSLVGTDENYENPTVTIDPATGTFNVTGDFNVNGGAATGGATISSGILTCSGIGCSAVDVGGGYISNASGITSSTLTATNSLSVTHGISAESVSAGNVSASNGTYNSTLRCNLLLGLNENSGTVITLGQRLQNSAGTLSLNHSTADVKAATMTCTGSMIGKYLKLNTPICSFVNTSTYQWNVNSRGHNTLDFELPVGWARCYFISPGNGGQKFCVTVWTFTNYDIQVGLDGGYSPGLTINIGNTSNLTYITFGNLSANTNPYYGWVEAMGSLS